MELAPSLGFTVEEADLELYDAYTADEIIICSTAGGLLAGRAHRRARDRRRPARRRLSPRCRAPTSGCSTRRSTAPMSDSNCRRRASCAAPKQDRRGTCRRLLTFAALGCRAGAVGRSGARRRSASSSSRPRRPTPASSIRIRLRPAPTRACSTGCSTAGAHQARPGEPGVHRARPRRELDVECRRAPSGRSRSARACSATATTASSPPRTRPTRCKRAADQGDLGLRRRLLGASTRSRRVDKIHAEDHAEEPDPEPARPASSNYHGGTDGLQARPPRRWATASARSRSAPGRSRSSSTSRSSS